MNPEATSGFSELGYYVHRTPSEELPVYHLSKRGGNLHQTKIRKVTGDRQSLCVALQENLGLDMGNIAVNPRTGNIIIKARLYHLSQLKLTPLRSIANILQGWHKERVKKFLEAQSL